MSIESQLRALASQSVIKAEKVIRLTINDIGNNMIIGSPVDSGLFRNNWLSGYSYDTSTRSGTGDESQGNLTESISAFTIGKTFYFTNSLPYAQKLEDGHSTGQAPFGVVKKNVAQFDTIAQGYINMVK